MKHFFFLIIFLLSLSYTSVRAQILNDSTRNVYGTKTTQTFKEFNFLRGNYTTRPVDTTLNNINQYRNWFQDTTFYQDLGNVGTASKPLIWQLPSRIGARYGKEVFNRYAYDPYAVTYFDTKSPYTHLFYVQGGLGEQVFEAKHSRSFKNIANIGFTFAKISGDKQIGVQQGSGRQNGQIDYTSIMVFGHVQNKASTYHLFANYTTGSQRVIESGGLRVNETFNQDSLFQDRSAPVFLYQAANEEKRNNAHATQFLNIAKEFLKVYHTIDYSVRNNKFYDQNLQFLRSSKSKKGVNPFYPGYRLDSVKTNDKSFYRELENSAGITGNHPLFFYKAYAKRRDGQVSFSTKDSFINPVDSSQKAEAISRRFGQNFIGGETQFKLKDIFNITAVGEYQLFKDYYFNLSGKVKFLAVSQTRTSYSPTFMQQAFVSNHYKWNNKFDNIIADRTAASLNIRFLKNTIQAEVARVNLQNYVFYDTTGDPRQLGNQLAFYTATLRHHLVIGSVHLNHFVQVNETSQAKAIRMPDWMVNSKIYFQGSLFKNALFGQLGVETYVAANYFADAYSPALQQFYLQNDFRVTNPLTNTIYPVVDVFLAADIKTLNLFVKMAHVNQGFPQPGYFTTPYYPALQRSFTFGIKWMFFD